MSHTRGPWATRSIQGDVYIIPSCDDKKAVGGAADPEIEAAEFAKQIAGVYGSMHTRFSRSRVMLEEREANARLIAAAPELLEACKRASWLYDQLACGPFEAAVKYGPDYTPPDEETLLGIQNDLQVAIAKAEGGK